MREITPRVPIMDAEFAQSCLKQTHRAHPQVLLAG